MRRQVALLVLLNAFVGAMVGLERTVRPVLAEREFGIASAAAATSFIVAFGLTKAFVNLFAGRLADRFGRKRVLIAGWILGLPVPIMIMLAPSWSFVVAANVLLGVNQGLTWSMTLNMKIDLVPRERRGLVVGLNETAGYTGLAVVAFVTGYLAQPFMLGIAIAVVGLAISLFTRESTGFLRSSATTQREPANPRFGDTAPPRIRGFALFLGGTNATTVGGLATNLKDGALWGLLPILLLGSGASLAEIAIIVAAYPLAWGLTQGGFGWWSDRVGRVPLIVAGLLIQALGVAWLALAPALAPALVTGIGTAMTYPTLLARVADEAPMATRATSLGVYRFWRDLGYAIGALGAGLVADALGIRVALLGVAAVVGAAAWMNATSGIPRPIK